MTNSILISARRNPVEFNSNLTNAIIGLQEQEKVLLGINYQTTPCNSEIYYSALVVYCDKEDVM